MTLNLGILAHVDAGKTSLTERLLYVAGVTDRIGRVDHGDTQTDTLALERERGITIRSAVVSFVVGDVSVNLIDTPGHPDFIAEVERVLGILDGAVLVISAVEGVQAQTRILMRTLRRLGIPTLIFVNKIDRLGAREAELVADIASKLSVTAIALSSVRGLGTRDAQVFPRRVADPEHRQRLLDLLTDHDDDLLARYVADPAVPDEVLQQSLVTSTRRGRLHPVFFGSAITGAGIEPVIDGITKLLPEASGRIDAAVSGTVFKIDRGAAGEKIAYLRLFDGTLRTRDRLLLRDGQENKITALEVFDAGPAARGALVRAGQIAKAWGLTGARVGERFGAARPVEDSAFAPPTVETVVWSRRVRDGARLHAALTQLAEQDPLINFRQHARSGQLTVSLYGEVQKEVIEATLSQDYRIPVAFEESTTICIERVRGTGAAVEFITDEANPFLATVGLRVEPGPRGSGASFGLETYLHGTLPLAFVKAVEEAVYETVQQGLRGWEVTDCRITMTHSGYYPRQSHAHATFDKSMSSVAGDFRGLTPLVLMEALQEAGTLVCEPISAFTLDLPADSLGSLLPGLTRLGGIPGTATPDGTTTRLRGELPAARVHELTRLLPGLTHGEGLLESAFDHYEPVQGPAPSRSRTDHDPLNRRAYLQQVKR